MLKFQLFLHVSHEWTKKAHYLYIRKQINLNFVSRLFHFNLLNNYYIYSNLQAHNQ